MNIKLQDKYLIYAIEILIVLIIFTGNSYSSSDILTFIGSILGSLLGVLGACLIFSRQLNNDKNNKRDVLLELLSYTLNKTEYLVDGYIDEVTNLIENEGIKRNWNKEDIKNLSKYFVIGIVGTADIDRDIDNNLRDKEDIIYYKIRDMEKKSLNGYNKELKDLHKLVYYKNWQESILYIDNKFREEIITWILYLEETKHIFNDLPSRYIRSSNECGSSQLNDRLDSEARLNYMIYQFIESREYIVEIMNKIYKSNKRFPTVGEIMKRGSL